MKKINLISLTIIFGLLCGCSKNMGNLTEIDMNKVSNILDSNLKNMNKVEEDELKDVYSLDTTNMEKYIIKVNKDGDLYAIIKCKDIEATKQSMEDYFKKVKDFNQSYSPERLKILENREEREIGNYIIYIVSKNSEELYQKIIKSL